MIIFNELTGADTGKNESPQSSRFSNFIKCFPDFLQSFPDFSHVLTRYFHC